MTNISIMGFFYGLSLLYIVYEIVRYFSNAKEEFKESSKAMNELLKNAQSVEEKTSIVKSYKSTIKMAFFEIGYMLWVIIGMLIPACRMLFITYFIFSFVVGHINKKLEKAKKIQTVKYIYVFDTIISIGFLVLVAATNWSIIFPMFA
jgi:uncharacterized membrane protein YphA (DoxX/SURF4 family)